MVPTRFPGADGYSHGATGSGGATQGDPEGTIFPMTANGKTSLCKFGLLNSKPPGPLAQFSG